VPLRAGWGQLNDADRDKTLQMRLTYECVARHSDEELGKRLNEYGNINVRDICFTDADFWVAPYEVADVRKGTMKFETSLKPFDGASTLVAGLMWAIGTLLVGAACIGAVALARWVWGGN
jgi:hypothetical protein